MHMHKWHNPMYLHTYPSIQATPDPSYKKLPTQFFHQASELPYPLLLCPPYKLRIIGHWVTTNQKIAPINFWVKARPCNGIYYSP